VFNESLTEFHEFYGWDGPELGFELRKTLISEECKELLEELDAENPDIRKVYKELADLIYVCYGLDVHIGGHLDQAFKAVHESNMTKLWDCERCEGAGYFDFDGNADPNAPELCTVCHGSKKAAKRREDGKILKPPTYEPPKLEFIPEETP
jgi:NTP pyrophosphatase (non-canonical NTP hydrolase)